MISVRKTRTPGVSLPWKVRTGRTLLAQYSTAAVALAFVRRLLAAAD